MIKKKRFFSKMRLNAENVLDDCKRALESLENIDSDEQLFRIHWLAVLVLLSNVGDVLRKIDCKNNKEVKNIWNIRFKELKENEKAHKIYWQFIKKERNSVAHLYESSYSKNKNTIVYIAKNKAILLLPNKKIDEIPAVNDEESSYYSLDSDIYRPMENIKEWQDIDCRDLIAEAILWWSRELSAIKKKILSNEA